VPAKQDAISTKLKTIMGQTALVAGASGLIGKQLIHMLLKDSHYEKVIALVRTGMDLKDPKLEQRKINFQDLEIELRNIKADDIFCCLGTTMKKAGSRNAFHKVDFEYVVNLAHQMKKKDARQFLVVSSMGASTGSVFFYNQVKGEMENALKGLNYLSLHIFRPSLLLGERSEKRTGEKAGIILAKLFSLLFIGPLKKYRAIESSVVASAMIKTAIKAEAGIFTYDSEIIQNLA
jgi:uncharacterized protein YbjT (DUF2867 family)